MKPIRILHTLCRVGSGGVEKRVKLLIKQLPRGEYEHRVICQDAFGELATRLPELGCEVVTIGRASSLLDPRWYARAIPPARAWAPDIIHGGVIEGNALANVLGLALPGARVISEETSDPRGRKRRTDHFLRALFLRSDAVIGVSPFVSDYLRTRVRVPERKLHTINNGVLAPDHFPAEQLERLAKKLGIAPDDEVIGSVGRLDDNHKRFSDIIAALPDILQERPRVRLLLVGDGDSRPLLERQVDKLGVGRAVIFAGYQGNPRPFYKLMQLFVLASAEEAFGLVLVEAMQAGVPIIATRVGGIPFVLGEGKAGRLIDPFRPDQIAASVCELLADGDARAALARGGLARARAEFSSSRYARDLDRLYKSLLPQFRRPA
jgi:glycosyltransferase involved in cell wall biosynthesis